MAAGTPPPEVDVDEALLRSLFAEQQPDLATLPIQLLDVGWDNFMFRLGDEFVARLPRRELAAKLLIHEQDWLPIVGRDLPLPIPMPVRCGRPGRGYPWRWSVVPWLSGATANLQPPSAEQAEPWAAFLKALHRAAPETAPHNPGRGVPLADRATAIEERMQRLEQATSSITSAVLSAWKQGLDAPPASDRRWLHGDLHARNVLVQNGKLSGVIDWGDLTVGDASTDLASVWMLFADRVARDRVLTLYGLSEDDRARAMAWAVLFGVLLLDTGLIDHPQHARMGQETLARVAADV